MTLRLIKMASLFVPLDVVCIVMVLKLQKAEWNSNALKSVIKMAASPVPAKLPAPMQNTDARFIWLWKIIQDYSTILQGAVRNGNWNTMQGLLLSVLTNARNSTLNLEDSRHRSTKMWYCRLYHILMLQHLDAWDLPPESPLKKLILNRA